MAFNQGYPPYQGYYPQAPRQAMPMYAQYQQPIAQPMQAIQPPPM